KVRLLLHVGVDLVRLVRDRLPDRSRVLARRRHLELRALHLCGDRLVRVRDDAEVADLVEHVLEALRLQHEIDRPRVGLLVDRHEPVVEPRQRERVLVAEIVVAQRLELVQAGERVQAPLMEREMGAQRREPRRDAADLALERLDLRCQAADLGVQVRLLRARGGDLRLDGSELRVEARLLLAEIVAAERRSAHEGESQDEKDHDASGHRKRGSSGRSASLPCDELYAAGRRESSSGGGYGSGTGAGVGGSPSSGGGYGSGRTTIVRSTDRRTRRMRSSARASRSSSLGWSAASARSSSANRCLAASAASASSLWSASPRRRRAARRSDSITDRAPRTRCASARALDRARASSSLELAQDRAPDAAWDDARVNVESGRRRATSRNPAARNAVRPSRMRPKGHLPTAKRATAIANDRAPRPSRSIGEGTPNQRGSARASETGTGPVSSGGSWTRLVWSAWSGDPGMPGFCPRLERT